MKATEGGFSEMNRLMENAVFGYIKELREHGSLTQEYENLYY